MKTFFKRFTNEETNAVHKCFLALDELRKCVVGLKCNDFNFNDVGDICIAIDEISSVLSTIRTARDVD